MAAGDKSEDNDFLAICEEEFKHRYTDQDEEFMKVSTAEPSSPPIIENWWVPHNAGRRNDRRNNRRSHTYEHSGNRDRDRGYQDRRDQYDRRDNRGYSDYRDRGGYDRGYGYQNKRPRY